MKFQNVSKVFVVGNSFYKTVNSEVAMNCAVTMHSVLFSQSIWTK